LETEDLLIFGEDSDSIYDDEHTEDKPIRVLSEFSFFDPKHKMELISLGAIEEIDGLDRQFEGAGLVSAFSFEEDEGQEDDIEDLEEQYVRLGAILRFSIDYTKINE
jgi:DNA (cytosine-5)-methyltransferase 1